ncbi:hypothetical protein EJB05_22817, partial [Eragrostis curvula]
MPPQPGSGAADDAAAPSRSVIIGAAATGRRLIEIEGYSHTKERLPNGRSVALRPFSVGGHSWQLAYYPNNEVREFPGFITISFRRLGELGRRSAGAPVCAQVTLSLLDAAGQPVPSHTESSGMMDFSNFSGISFHEFINRAWLEESEHLVDNRFTIMCEVVVPMEVRVEERGAKPPPTAAPPLVMVPPSNLHQNFGALLSSKEGADVMFEVAAAVIFVDDMEAEVFRALLAFVYTDALPDSPKMKEKEEAAMAQHLLVAADRYNMERLKLICEDKLCKHINTGTVGTILALAEQHNCAGLKKACLHFLGSSSILNDVIATESFEHLARSCPSVMKELISNISTPVPTDLGETSQRDMGWHAMLPFARQTSYWCRVMVMVVLSVVSSLKGGNALLSCLCLVVAFLCGYKLTEKLI